MWFVEYCTESERMVGWVQSDWKHIDCPPSWSHGWSGASACYHDPASREIICPRELAWEKIKIQNLNYGFYWIHIALSSSPRSPKILSQTIVCWGLLHRKTPFRSFQEHWQSVDIVFVSISYQTILCPQTTWLERLPAGALSGSLFTFEQRRVPETIWELREDLFSRWEINLSDC